MLLECHIIPVVHPQQQQHQGFLYQQQPCHQMIKFKQPMLVSMFTYHWHQQSHRL